MKHNKELKLRFFARILGFLFLLSLVSAPVVLAADAADDVQTLKEQLNNMSQQMEELQKKIDAMEKADSEKKEEIKEMDERLNKAELHTATDKISFGIDFRTRVDSIHYKDMLGPNPQFLNQLFLPWNPLNPPAGGLNGAPIADAQAALQYMAANGLIPPPVPYDYDNDLIWTNRLRLPMKAKVNDKLSFAGRLAMYKVFGDSAGVRVYDGNSNTAFYDGTTTSLPWGDSVRVERAYFNYKGSMGSIPTNFSLGRRPSTEGPPLEYRNFSLEGGSPLATIINWQFDGASFNMGLEEATGVPGAALKLCYGVGFEGDLGNFSSLSANPTVNDVNMYGFIATLYDDDSSSAVMNYAYAPDITDGFTGLTVMPFVAYTENGDIFFQPNYGAFVTRLEPSTNIGDWQAATLLFRTNLTEKFDKDIDLFLAGSWSHTHPTEISKNPFFELQGASLLSSNGNLESHDGYMIYAGAIFPMPLEARLGLEYNYGSEYWFNFTGAEDSLVSSKLATRGQVYEAYYIQPIFNHNFFVQVGGQYYDYNYTGSGNPLGAPVDIDEATTLDTMFPVPDKVWDLYASVTLRY